MKTYDVTITFRVECDEDGINVLCDVLEDSVEQAAESEGHEIEGPVTAHVKEVKESERGQSE